MDILRNFFWTNGSNFGKMCCEYNLNTIEEILNFFEKCDDVLRKKYSYLEIKGIFNILKYIYLSENISFWNKLNKPCISPKGNKKGDKFDYLYNKYNSFFRELGFSSSEVFEICGELNYLEPLGESLVKIYNKKILDEKITSNLLYITFVNKLKILVGYYLNNKSVNYQIDSNDYKLEKVKK